MNLLAISGLALEVVDGQRQVEVVVYQRGEPFHVKHRYSVLEGAARARRRWSGVEQGDRGDALSDETREMR